MARLIRDVHLETRTARLALKLRNKPYWRSIEPGLALGYYRGKTGGAWFVRRLQSAGKYETERLRTADDHTDADGINVISYAEAIAAARAWWLEKSRIDNGGDVVSNANYTVGNALDDYLTHLIAKGARDIHGAKGKINARIRPTLGTEIVSKLTARRVAAFQALLAAAPRLTRSGKPAVAVEGDSRNSNNRARQATANRTMTVLKAALNLAFREGRVQTDEAWRRVRPFGKTDVARRRYLKSEEIVRLDRVLPMDFRSLCRGALLTGARYSELAAVQVSDVDLAAGTLLLRVTKNGKPRHAYLTEEGSTLFSGLILRRRADNFIFMRANGERWKDSDQARPLRKACIDAGIVPEVTFRDLRNTFGALLAQRGVPLQVIAAALGHSDTRITEKHYAHLCPSYVANSIRRGLPRLNIDFGSQPQNKSTPMQLEMRDQANEQICAGYNSRRR